jgi:hypothetical protein
MIEIALSPMVEPLSQLFREQSWMKVSNNWDNDSTIDPPSSF